MSQSNEPTDDDGLGLVDYSTKGLENMHHIAIEMGWYEVAIEVEREMSSRAT